MKPFRTIIHQVTLYYDVNEDEAQEVYGCSLDELDARTVMEKDNRLNVRVLVERADDRNITGWSVSPIRGTIDRSD